MDMLLDILIDTVVDTVKVIPFLFVVYLVMEWMERRTGERARRTMEKYRAIGPLPGGIIG